VGLGAEPTDVRRAAPPGLHGPLAVGRMMRSGLARAARSERSC
jgi:hypothetical protein